MAGECDRELAGARAVCYRAVILTPSGLGAASPKSTGRRKVGRERAGSARLCQQPHLALLALVSLPRGGGGRGLRSQHQGALPWKGTKEVRREGRGEWEWPFPLLEWNIPVLGKTSVGSLPYPPSTIRDGNPFPSGSSSFPAKPLPQI